MLTIYRRHNPKKCSSKDTQQCTNKRRPCPIWIRGSKPDGTYIREPLDSRDWNKALDVMREIEATGVRPKPVVARKTIEEWKDQFIQNAKTENRSPETIRKYKAMFEQLIEFAEDKGFRYPSDFDLESLEEFRNTWKDAPLSKSKKQERLRGIFRFALARKWTPDNPAQGLGRIKVDDGQKIPFSADEMTKILKHAKAAGPQIYTFVLVMRFSGLRISDVCTLKADSLQGNHLVLRTVKTGAPVKVLLPDVAADGLRKIKKASAEYFFWNGSSKLESVTDLWRNHRLKPVFDTAKVAKAHPHRFRHTFAVELLKNGTPAGIVASLLGNSERIVTKHYSAWVAERQKGLDEAVTKANGYHELAPVGR
jgi:site-specific recombinase XerD